MIYQRPIKTLTGYTELESGTAILAFSASSYGSLVATILAGYVSDRFKPKIVITLAILGMSIMTSLAPLLAGIHYWAFFFGRTIQGISGGFLFPAGCALASRWFPMNEKSTLAAIYGSGSGLGGSLVPMVVAFLCTSSMGWSAVFYPFGVAGFVYVGIWIFFVSNNPSNNYFTSDKEKEFLAKEIDFTGNHDRKHLDEGATNFPWLRLFLSPVLLANYACQFSFQFTQTVMQLFLPMFFRDHLGFSIKENGYYTTLPFVLNVVMGFVWGLVADFMKNNKILSPKTCGKVCQTIDCFGTAFAMMMLYFLPTVETPGRALPFLVIYGLCFPAGVGGYFTSLLSICPRYSGTVMSINRGWGMASHLGTPMLMTFLSHLGLSSKYLIMFGLASFFQVFAGVLFLIFGDLEIQEWAKHVPSSNQISAEIGENGTTVEKSTR
ncbi:unnamed protein product, partial [Mesorhabditis belari]|uniref:Major facilitator superfamily (MFS) profile domain-containing protein n=1 Tax=Mesorhabditis belari TaxID=2138241 RepID=A0AAF3ERQ1_9BILA